MLPPADLSQLWESKISKSIYPHHPPLETSTAASFNRTSDLFFNLSDMGLSEKLPRARGGFGRLSYSGTRPWPEVPVGNHQHDSAAVVIIGAGIAGMNMAIDLLTNRKVKSFIIIEKGGGFGGTWRDNKFPGCCCDVWSHLYCYSFEQNPDWSRAYPGQEEILV